MHLEAVVVSGSILPINLPGLLLKSMRHLEVYAGKQPNGQFQLPKNAAGMLCLRRCGGGGRNVTVDNIFTSVPLAQDVYQNDLGRSDKKK